MHDIFLKTLNNDLVFEQWKLSSNNKKQLLENNLIQIIAHYINEVPLNNVLYY